MNSEPTSESVSVILPYFNRADTLEASALSVLTQSYENLILYMVNDGSSDRSRDVARSIKDARIHHVDLAANLGACAARNLGLQNAETSLVAFMDSDDEWLPEKLQKQVAHLRSSQSRGQPISVVGCGWRYHDRVGPGRQFESGPFTRLDVLRGVAGTGTPMLLVDRRMGSPGASFDPAFTSLEERDYVLSCLANGSFLGVVPEVLAVVTRGRADHVANPAGASEAWETYLTKYHDDFAVNDRLRSFYHFRAAREHLVANERRKSTPHILDALRDRSAPRAAHLALGALGGARGLAVAQRLFPL